MVKHEIQYVEINDRENYAIRLTESEFESILFTIGEVKFSEPDENDNVVMSFHYTVIENTGEILTEEQENKFRNTIGDLIIESLENQIQEGYDGNIAFTGGI